MDADNWTPLHHACAKGHLDIVKLIKSKDERKFEKFIQMKTNTKASCIHLAVQNGNIDLIKYIFSIFDDDTLKKLINEEAEPFGTTLHIAGK